MLPHLQRRLTELQTEVSYLLLPVISSFLHEHERVLVRGRVKDCESAVDKLRRRQEGARFDDEHTERYSLLTLTDLVGVQVLAFPPKQVVATNHIIRQRIAGWKTDHLVAPDNRESPLVFKYHGLWKPGDPFDCEIQVVSLLTGLFWDVEHSAIYKPSSILRGMSESLVMERQTRHVLSALRDFEEAFEKESEESAALGDMT